MDGVRQAWGKFLSRVYHSIAEFVVRLYEGLANDWNVRAFIVVMSLVVVLSGITMWRRRA